ncbi:threonine synthase [Oceanicaulis sp. AH-315-P02]|nr:threonine synthase [Oceanicaulis sp. AH-315-P02]
MLKQYANFLTHLECGLTGEHHEAGLVHGLSNAGKPLLARYDLEAMKAKVDRDQVWARDGGFWKWRELLPVADTNNVCELGEVDTPLIQLNRLHKGSQVWVKDEGRLPTGSFKARGLALAVAMAKELGLSHLAMPTNGNAGSALAAYASRIGMQSTVVCPDDTPSINIEETALQGAEVFKANGLINACGAWVKAGAEQGKWFDLSTLKEPYRIEGKKTMGLELAAQMGWTLPDVIFYPTGGGTGLIGMCKAFDELLTLGWLEKKDLPRMIAVQSTGCAPIVRAYERGERFAEVWQDAHTFAAGIRVPAAVGDFLILDGVRDSAGFAIAVTDEAIEQARIKVAKEEGLLLCPEGAATYAAYTQSIAGGTVTSQECVVLFNCATGLKYPMPSAGVALDLEQGHT